LPCFHELLCDIDDTLYFVSGDGYAARTQDVLERLSHILQNDNGADILRRVERLVERHDEGTQTESTGYSSENHCK